MMTEKLLTRTLNKKPNQNQINIFMIQKMSKRLGICIRGLFKLVASGGASFFCESVYLSTKCCKKSKVGRDAILHLLTLAMSTVMLKIYIYTVYVRFSMKYDVSLMLTLLNIAAWHFRQFLPVLSIRTFY